MCANHDQKKFQLDYNILFCLGVTIAVVLALIFVPIIPLLFKVFLIPLAVIGVLITYFGVTKKPFRHLRNQSVMNYLVLFLVILFIPLLILEVIWAISMAPVP